MDVLRAAGGLLSEFVAAVLPPLLDAFNSLLQPVAMFAGMVFSAAKDMLQWLSPALAALGGGLAKVIAGLASFLSPLLQIVAIFGGAFLKLVANSLVPLVSKLAEVVAMVVGGLGDMLNIIGKFINRNINLQKAVTPAEQTKYADQFARSAFVSQLQSGLVGMFSGARERAGSAWGAVQKGAGALEDAGTWLRNREKGAPSTPKKQVLDFRGSQFNITQQFAEGFDPDRIAAVFAKDVSRLGEMRRQSGLAPLYAVR